MTKKRRFVNGKTIILLVIILLSTSSITYALSFDRVSGITSKSGSGVTTQWGGSKSDGTIKSRVEVTRAWNQGGINIGKSQVQVCKTVTPNFTGNAKIKTTVVLNGELSATSNGLWKIPGGQSSADLHLRIQVKQKVYSQGLMFVNSSPFFPHSKSYNNETRSYIVTEYVTKGIPIEICGGIMTNAGVSWGGGKAYSDFYSSRFARTYVKDLTLYR